MYKVDPHISTMLSQMAPFLKKGDLFGAVNNAITSVKAIFHSPAALSAGAIVGIILGAMAFVILVAFVLTTRGWSGSSSSSGGTYVYVGGDSDHHHHHHHSNNDGGGGGGSWDNNTGGGGGGSW